MRIEALGGALVMATAACGPGVQPTSSVGAGDREAVLSGVTAAQWQGLAARRIFFGHQSVGRNIVDGMSEVLAAHPEIPLRIVESRQWGAAPAFYHAMVGRNGSPLEKLSDFVGIVDSSTKVGAVAMLKFCYVDVEPETDARSLFERYRQQVADLRARHPEVTIVHFTMPLTTAENWKGVLMSRLRGVPLERDRNLVRNRYNALLREAYGRMEPIFDIAALESTAPDGSRSFFTRGADTVYTMLPAYTGDGGHLNEMGRRRIAERLLSLLARLPAPKAGEG